MTPLLFLLIFFADVESFRKHVSGIFRGPLKCLEIWGNLELDRKLKLTTTILREIFFVRLLRSATIMCLRTSNGYVTNILAQKLFSCCYVTRELSEIKPVLKLSIYISCFVLPQFHAILMLLAMYVK